MCFHAASCASMLPHVLPCCLMCFHAALGASMLPHVLPCCLVCFHAASCASMLPHVLPCCLMCFHAASCASMLPRYISGHWLERESQATDPRTPGKPLRFRSPDTHPGSPPQVRLGSVA
ncbi:hypothetical protein CLOM_g23084 [Closterium sp. NIES-68]|nr:hypothetical protein CLOM_g23084 [Closterium sp. NIES-68]GJP61527.1 hypothetical protein CLOP_g18678 [Closterium sp. NIES-67]